MIKVPEFHNTNHTIAKANCIFALRVNYFSHYYFDHLPGEETHNFGLSLPDFVRNFIPGKKMKPLLTGEIETSAYPSIALGTSKHFQRDQIFHSSDFFKKSEFHLNSVLKPVFQSLSIGRYWFASHILSEMMIDRVLMKQYPETMDNFYQDLSAADIDEIEQFLFHKGFDNFEIFSNRLSRFRQSEYLRQYTHDPALIYSLNRVFIYAKAGEEWTPEQYRELQNLVPEIEAYFTDNIHHLFSEM